MLVLSRKVGEKIVIGDNITVVINKVAGNRISLAIEAPSNVRIVRGELAEAAHSFEDHEPVDTSCAIPHVPAFRLVSDLVSHRAR